LDHKIFIYERDDKNAFFLQLVFESHCSTESNNFSFSSYDCWYLITDSATEIRFLLKSNKYKDTGASRWMTRSVFCLNAQDIFLKLSVSQLPNITLKPKRIQQFIVVFTWHKSYTVAFSQYTAFMKLYIL
jgi:hypothetical protein